MTVLSSWLCAGEEGGDGEGLSILDEAFSIVCDSATEFSPNFAPVKKNAEMMKDNAYFMWKIYNLGDASGFSSSKPLSGEQEGLDGFGAFLFDSEHLMLLGIH